MTDESIPQPEFERTFGPGAQGLMEAVDHLNEVRKAKIEARDPSVIVPDKLVDDLVGGISLSTDWDTVADPELQKIYYKEPPGPEGVSPKKAAEDYSRFRTERAAQVLQGIQEQLDQEQRDAEISIQETPPEPETPPPPQYTAEDLERQAFQQKANEQLAALEQGRQNYELALQQIAAQQCGVALSEFSDIRDQSSLEAMRRNDPQRALRYDRLCQQNQALAAELNKAAAARIQLDQHRQDLARSQYQQQFAEYAKAQEAIIEQQNLIPEIRDEKSPESRKFQRAAADLLEGSGFSRSELIAAWQHGQPLSLRDARVQRVIADAVRWNQAQARAAEINQHRKPVPPVQRPGVQFGGVGTATIQRADRAMERLRSSGSVNDAVEALRAQRAARAR